MNYNSLISTIAKKYNNHYPAFGYEDLKQEGHIAILQSSSPKWIRKNIIWHLNNICKKSSQKRTIIIEPIKDRDFKASETFLQKLKKEISEEAQYILQVIFEAPSDILEIMCPSTCNKAKEIIKNQLKSEGWINEKINNTWKEIKECL